MNDSETPNAPNYSSSRRTFLITTGLAGLVSCADDKHSTSNSNNTNNANNTNNTNNINNSNNTNTDGGVDADGGQDVDGGNPIPRPTTTITKTIIGVLEEAPLFEDLRPYFGLTEDGPGEPWLDRDDLNALSFSDGSVAAQCSLSYFSHMSDVHIIDEESPARVIHSPIASNSAWRPQEVFTSQLLDSAMRTINAFAEIRPQDFMVFSGDVTDNHLGTELALFLKVLEGGIANPDTGVDDDPRPGTLPDPHDPFQASGLSPSVPWYICMGNHDVWYIGSVNTPILAAPTGDSATLWLSDSVTPTCFNVPQCVGGYCYSDVPDRCHVPTSDDYFSNASVVADSNRFYHDMQSFMQTIAASTTHGPPGHGFTADNIDNEFSYWMAESPIPGIPVALISLDTTSACTSTDRSLGALDAAQMAWLEEQLVLLESQNKLVIIISHHPANEVENMGAQLIALFHEYPNVVLHVVGHGHLNRVYPHPSPTPSEPWRGYWEVQVPSNIDWPQQIRFYEIANNGDGTGVIYATLVDYSIAPGHVAEGGRFYALLDVQEGRGASALRGEPTDRNVKLHFALPPDLRTHLDALPHRDVESLHFLPD
ncbi:metallophosphoesterase [Myxococcota bacterium]|nr:metallophosphoesterase [Myxococcota bacterium]MBU1534282.1 metallophosphoesterase [Myxococcota bacterium]